MSLRDLSGFVGLMFLLFLLLGVHGFVTPPDSFLAPASPFSHTGGTCPLNLDPEDARLSVSSLVKLSRMQSERVHAAFVVSVQTLCLRRMQALPSAQTFIAADAPPPVLPGHNGPAAFALPPPFSA